MNRPAAGDVDRDRPGFTDPEEPETPAEERTRLLIPFLVVHLRWAWPWLLLTGLTYLGWQELQQVDLQQVAGAVRQTGADLVLALLAATALNLAILGLYDVVALGALSQPPRLTERWSIGVLSFAWSNFLTVGPLAGPALRLWLYRPLGVEGRRSRSALTSILSAFSLGLLAWCVAVTLPLPGRIDFFSTRVGVGALLAASAAALLRGASRLPFAPPTVRRWEGNPATLAAVAATDWLLAWIVFHLALRGLAGPVDPRVSLSAFFIGQLVGLASFVPGGLGTADAFWLLVLGNKLGGHDRVLGALLVYRIFYYVLPWAVATLVLAGRLVRTGRRTGAFLRTVIASYTFLCGSVLLASAATPSLAGRLDFLRRSVPLALVEISHGVSVVLGFLLLVISRGLARGYRSSHRLALALFLAGTLTTFLKGLDFEEAFLSLAAVALLLVFREPFHRAGRLRPSSEFIISVGVFAVVLFAAIGFGSHATVPDFAAVFSHFGFFAQGARFLRGLLLLTALAAVAALNLTLHSMPQERLPDPEEIDRALADVQSFARSTNPMLVAVGDKAIYRASSAPLHSGKGGPPPEGFIAYRAAGGHFLVAYSDPVCAPENERALLASFLDQAAAFDREVVLYQISAAFLPVAHDFGFNFFKLGEEGIVDLRRFDLKGNKAKTWRHVLNSVEKAGGRFELVEGEPLRELLPELREVSDSWLREKRVTEKRFSVGHFSEAYLLRFPCVVVRDGSGRVWGFANVLNGPRGEELSIDLMRYQRGRREESGLENVMDYLFVRLMLLGKERGYTRFNLGMAPLAAVGEMRWAKPFERLAHLFFRHGEAWYNYQGLRRYKEKFDPVWEPRYMAYPRPWDWPLATGLTALLIAGGWRSALFPKRVEK